MREREVERESERERERERERECQCIFCMPVNNNQGSVSKQYASFYLVQKTQYRKSGSYFLLRGAQNSPSRRDGDVPIHNFIL